MVRSLMIVVAVVASVACAPRGYASTQVCRAEKSALDATQRQLNSAQSNLFRQQNSLFSLQNRIDNRILSLQLQVDNAAAWRQAAGGINAGNSFGCAIRTIFGGGRCFANSVAQAIRLQAQANARYNLAVNRLTTYQNSAAMQLSRQQQRVADEQLRYDAALASLKQAEQDYQSCLDQPRTQGA